MRELGPTRAGRWRLGRSCAVALALVSGACVPSLVLPSVPVAREFDRRIDFYGHALTVHFVSPPASEPARPLLLYATGDGGWHGLASQAYARMARWGYPVAAFSAPDYLKHLGFVSGTTTPQRLALDYQRLTAFAKSSLGLPADRPTILVGISRGAGLAVVAAGQPGLRRELAGVLAVALTKEEEYVRHYRVRRGKAPADMPRRELVEIDTYEALDDLLSLPLVVVQSTHDSYLPAADARTRFGADTDTRKLFAIDAKNHNFSHAREPLYDRMQRALAWIVDMAPPGAERGHVPGRDRRDQSSMSGSSNSGSGLNRRRGRASPGTSSRL
jgi:hypothetical protein